MQFFSIYDLLVYKAKERDITMDQMYAYFRKRGIKKSDIQELEYTMYVPTNSLLLDSISSFLDMSHLEIELALGKIPAKYRESYFSQIKEIARLLDEETPRVCEDILPYFSTENGVLYNADCIKVMKQMPDACVDLVFADPPFNLGKTYDPGINDHMSMSEYINWMYEWLDQCVRILKPGGRIFIYNLPKWNTYAASYLNQQLTFWHWIAVDMKYSLPIQGRLYPAHYALISFIKGTKATTYNNQRIPMQVCKHCGQEQKDYGGYKSKMNPLGINISDVWGDIYPVRHQNSKNRKYNELSVKLMDRIISMSTNEGDTVFDPFGGSGVTFAVAQLLNRRWIGCELGDCNIIRKRLMNPEPDMKRLDKVRSEKGTLFTEEIEKLRKKKGLWTCSTFHDRVVSDDEQISFKIDEI